jgi:drug/metabolite transporter (DMT)-like permease
MSMVMGFLAIKTGSLSLSALIMQYSLIVPAIYGILMLGEPPKITLFIGLLLLIVSLILVNLSGKEEHVRPTLKWAIIVGLSFIGNGACVTVQKVQQVDFNRQYISEFMIVSIAISVLILLCLTLIFDRKELAYNVKKGGLIAAGSGMCNGIANFLMLVLAGILPASVMYPVVAAGGTITSSLAALLIYREKMSGRQLLGLGIGILAIIALNL